MGGGRVRALREVDFVQQAVGSHCQDFERSGDGVEPAPGKGGFQGSLDGTGETSTSVKVTDDEGTSPGARAQPAG